MEAIRIGKYTDFVFLGPRDGLGSASSDRQIREAAKKNYNSRDLVNLEAIAAKKVFAEYDLFGLKFLIAEDVAERPTNIKGFFPGDMFINGYCNSFGALSSAADANSFAGMIKMFQGIIDEFSETQKTGVLIPNGNTPIDYGLLLALIVDERISESLVTKIIEQNRSEVQEQSNDFKGNENRPVLFSKLLAGYYGDLFEARQMNEGQKISELKQIILGHLASDSTLGSDLVIAKNDYYSSILQNFAIERGLRTKSGENLVKAIVQKDTLEKEGITAVLAYKVLLKFNRIVDYISIAYTVASKGWRQYYELTYQGKIFENDPERGFRVGLTLIKGNHAAEIQIDNKRELISNELSRDLITQEHLSQDDQLKFKLEQMAHADYVPYETQIQRIAKAASESRILRIEEILSNYISHW